MAKSEEIKSVKQLVIDEELHNWLKVESAKRKIPMKEFSNYIIKEGIKADQQKAKE